MHHARSEYFGLRQESSTGSMTSHLKFIRRHRRYDTCMCVTVYWGYQSFSNLVAYSRAFLTYSLNLVVVLLSLWGETALESVWPCPINYSLVVNWWRFQAGQHWLRSSRCRGTRDSGSRSVVTSLWPESQERYNLTVTLMVGASSAPTAIFDKSGHILMYPTMLGIKGIIVINSYIVFYHSTRIRV